MASDFYPGCCTYSTCDLSVFLPHARGQPAEQEGDVALDKGREESKHAVDGERNKERLPSADAISQPPPHEGPDHHPQIHDQTYGDSVGDKSISQTFAKIQERGLVCISLVCRNIKKCNKEKISIKENIYRSMS